MGYETPAVVDYGGLVELTEMLSVTGPVEDSSVKSIPFHHTPPVSPPAGP